MEIIPAHSDEQLKAIEVIAQEIWSEHYMSIIGKDQIDYMLAKFQSFEVMKRQIAEGFEYYSIITPESLVGYIGFNFDEDHLFLSKLYLHKSVRGKGFGRLAMFFIQNKAKAQNKSSIRLTVNKYNKLGINSYKALGFKRLKSVVMDIGNGFVMDDYVLSKTLDHDSPNELA